MVHVFDDLVFDVYGSRWLGGDPCLSEASWTCVPSREGVIFVYVSSLELCIGLAGSKSMYFSLESCFFL